MITLKFAYKIIFGDKELLEKLRKQFTSLVHIFYNLIVDTPKITCREVKERIKDYNNIELMDSILIQYAYEKAYEIYKCHNVDNKGEPAGHKLVFGERKNLIKTSKHTLTKKRNLKS